MGRKYPQVFDGDVIRPVRKGYRIKCCECSLVHRIDFSLAKVGNGRVIQLKISRDNRATAACRRKKVNDAG